MSFDYHARVTIGVCLSEGQIRDPDTRAFKPYVFEDDEDNDYTIGIKHPNGALVVLEDTGEGPMCYYLGEHTYGSDWRRNPEEEFFPAGEMELSLMNMKLLLRETLEPLGLWDESAFGVYFWADIS